VVLFTSLYLDVTLRVGGSEEKEELSVSATKTQEDND